MSNVRFNYLKIEEKLGTYLKEKKKKNVGSLSYFLEQIKKKDEIFWEKFQTIVLSITFLIIVQTAAGSAKICLYKI